MTGRETAISGENLKKTCRSKSSQPVSAPNGLSLQVKRGEIYGLLGRNGAGKTTLIPLASGSASIVHSLTASPSRV